jgi:hypothetical protein
MTLKRTVLAGLVVGSFTLGMAVAANATSPRLADSEVVVTGAYRCPGDFSGGGLQHSMTFNTTDGGNLSIENHLDNLDTGDCTPRGQNAIDLTKKLGCTTGPLYQFQPGGGPGSAFGFVCKGERSYILGVIKQLSVEILRPTQPGVTK